MKIHQLIAQNKPFFSLEFFPPREKSAWPGFFEQVAELKQVDPLFVSVTYGAGGSTQDYTLEIVTRLKQDYGLEPMAHLTCVSASKQRISDFLDRLNQAGVQNVLALRGDPPQGQTKYVPDNEDFHFAYDLVKYIKKRYPGMGVGVAAYPEGHVEAPDLETDIYFLRLKLDTGSQFAITQLFFDNDLYFKFVEMAKVRGIEKPIIPGILPVTSLGVIKKSINLSGATLPEGFMESLEQAHEEGGPAQVRKVGTEHAIAQIRELLDRGAPGIHLYTLNKADTCLEIVKSLTQS
ncbi:methylenetetrahydrofolate reductase [NAD(P)H] [Desulfonatronovibrio magnus]|uniref:methylenetetrahydrofolate reductase [NAD(P)H] n=1 Tax=Desulfonatronovibrio magnus TaxID=698827 RepID=UPI0005EAEFB2|nr:methylenetetrahydrofolate reductase [NAD(P)H] [Desulfonatronovibrio magnus]